jgi:dipeptidyl aminopeptidase/acylaminoacyl peptidase
LLTYVTQLDPKLFDYATKHIAISPPAGGEAKVLTLALDRVSITPRFSPDGKSIYFIADDDGTQNICRVPVTGGEITRPVSGRLMVNDYSLAPAGDVVAQIATIDRPDELFAVSSSDGKLTQITHTNDNLMSQLKLAHGEYVHFKSKDGTIVSGYIYKPLDYVSSKKYPAILRPHGGPTWAYYAEFALLPQLLAANGYAVLFPNPRGSTGYGEKFAKAIYADWGNKDFQDDMAMVDYAIEHGIADPDKLGVGAGPTAASPRTSSSPRRRVSKLPFLAPARGYFRQCTDTTNTSANMRTRSVYLGRIGRYGIKFLLSIGLRTSSPPPSSWAAKSIGTFPSSAANKCFRP